jgi:hypothetical protein
MTQRHAPKTVVAAFRTLISQHNLHVNKLINDHWIQHAMGVDWANVEAGLAYQASEDKMVYDNNQQFKAALQQLADAAGLTDEYNVIKIDEINTKLDKQEG